MTALERDVRGTGAIEVALVLPVLLLLMGGAVDFGFAYAQVQRLSGAARLGAQAAADATSGQSLVGGVSGQAQQAALAAVQQALPDLAGRLQVTVAWDGGPTQTQAPNPGATLTVQMPQLATQSQTLDFQHSHSAWYLQPTFGNADWGQWSSPGIGYNDTQTTVGWSPSTWWSTYPYWDLTNWADYGSPNGGFSGPAVCCGWAFGWWWGANGDFLVDTPSTWWSRWTNWTAGTAWGLSANGWYGAWRRTAAAAFWQPDQVQYQSGWQWAQTSTPRDGPVVAVGPYETQTGTQPQQIPSDPQTTTMTTRVLRVTVSTPATPVTPLMVPILGNRLLVGSGDAAATTAQ